MSALDTAVSGQLSHPADYENARAELAALRAELKQVTAERNAFIVESDMVHRNINEMCGTDTSTFEAVQHVIDERDAAREALKVYERQKALRQ